MSAAEPANPARAYVNASARGAVIDITKRSRRGSAAQTAQGRWNSMVTPPPADRPGQTSLEAFAETIETVFNGLTPRRSLSDDDTAVIYLTTLEIVTRLLQGSHTQGDIDAVQLSRLEELVAGLKRAPDLV